MSPVNASKKENELRVWRNLYPDHLEINDIKPKFSVGDKVRVSKKKKTLEKGYTTRWTEEIFTITEVKRTSPVTYKIADLNGEEITGTFYEPELQKTSQELYRTEKVIKRGKTKSLVKWKGYSDNFNSWVNNKNGKTKIYFDSYGVQPPIEVVKYLGSLIRYNTDQLQPAVQVFCGLLCLYVLKELGAGNKFQTVLIKLF